MTITIIIIAYVASVFLNRWLNKLMSKKIGLEPIPILWFLPLVTTLALLYIMIVGTDLMNWFTGKHWNNK